MDNTIVVVEPDHQHAKYLGRHLAMLGWEVQCSESAHAALHAVRQLRPRAVFVERDLPDMTGEECLRRLQQMAPKAMLIVMARESTACHAVAAIKAGAADYLIKPVATHDVNAVLKRLAAANPSGEIGTRPQAGAVAGNAAVTAVGGMSMLLGESPAMQGLRGTVQHLVSTAHRLADGELPAVLITGETGTGKELVARALHFDGPRRSGPFVEINCASIPAHLLEAELFGHQRGAFTDAKESRIGLVEAADGGTLFLDEVGEIDPAVQAKLLKLLEDKTIRPLGTVKEKKVNLQIVSATNRDLAEMVRQGKFRSDLYFRLRILSLRTPPLRERGNDVIALANHFLAQHGARYGKPALRFSADARASLQRYSWPGNVRELRNMLEQTVLLAAAEEIGAHQLPICRELDGRHAPETPSFAQQPDVRAPVGNDVALDLLRRTLEKTNWNVTKSARLLGLSRDMLRYRMDKFQLTRPAFVA